MTFEMHASIAAGTRDTVEIAIGERGRDRVEFEEFPARLRAMAERLGARRFFVLTFSPALGGKRQIRTRELLAGGLSGAKEAEAGKVPVIGDGLSAVIAGHVGESALPIFWTAPDRKAVRIAQDCRHLLRAAPPVAAMPAGAGIAFPVVLGAVGSGAVVFTGDGLDISGERLLGVHRTVFRIVGELMRLDMLKSAPSQTLNEREVACLQSAGDGMKSEQIACKLGLSVHTVNAYLGSATAKLDSVNRIQAIGKALRLGYIV